MWQTYILENLPGSTDLERLRYAATLSNCTVYATKAVYVFDSIPTNETLVKIIGKDNLFIDWQGALIKVSQNNQVENYATCFIDFVDSTGGMSNYTFDDVSYFDEVNAGASHNNHSDRKGVIAVRVQNKVRDTSGYVFSNIHIYRGQSILTVASDTLKTASNITLAGNVWGTYSYYGVNLANSGSHFKMASNCSYRIHSFHRLFFIYGVIDVTINCTGYKGIASSANGLLTTLNAKYNTSIIRINCNIDILSGPYEITSDGKNLHDVIMNLEAGAAGPNMYAGYGYGLVYIKKVVNEFNVTQVTCNLKTDVVDRQAFTVAAGINRNELTLKLNNVPISQ